MRYKVLEYAYYNDFVDSTMFTEKTLDKYVKKGLLENKHKHHKHNYYVYWITEKGIKELFKKWK